MGTFWMCFRWQAALAEASTVVTGWSRPPAISHFTWKWLLNQHRQETLRASSVPVWVRLGWEVDISAEDVASRYQPALVPERGETRLEARSQGWPSPLCWRLSSVLHSAGGWQLLWFRPSQELSKPHQFWLLWSEGRHKSRRTDEVWWTAVTSGTAPCENRGVRSPGLCCRCFRVRWGLHG